MKRKSILVSLSLLFILFPMFTGYAADTSFYEGKIVTIIVATEPGGNYDFFGRRVAQYMRQYLPGCKAVIVKNVPGAGHVTGAMTIARSKPDGLTIGLFNMSLVNVQIGGLEGAKLDLANMSWIGVTGRGPFAILASPKKAKNWEEFKKADRIIVGVSGPGAAAYGFLKLVADMAGLKNIEMLGGYGGSEADNGMMRGDIHVVGSPSFELVQQGIAVPIIFSGGKLKGYEHVPLLQEIFPEKKNKPLVDYLGFIVGGVRAFSGPPGIPPERLELLREAFRKTVQHPEFVASVVKTGQNAGYESGQEFKESLEGIFGMSPENLSKIKSILSAK
jgi:tripartite-type tricarboxylate transporter receptor subunit TctC